MKRTLPVVLLLVAFAAYAKKPPVKARPPPPPPVEEPVKAEEEEAAPLPDDTIDPERADPDDEAIADEKTSPTTKKGKNDLTDDEAAGVAIGMLCCCSVMLIGLIALIVWLVKRGSGTPKPAPVQGGYPQPPQPHSPSVGGMQLSIFALALEPPARELIEQQLSQLGISSVPTNPETRGRLVREAARALLTVQPSWRQFGYGEKPGISDLPSAETSYRSASEDFRARAVSVGATASADSGLVVVTLLICSRRPLLGVSRLDDPLQVRNVLEDRMRVIDSNLLGAELLWAPAAAGGRVSEAEIGLRFPEMLPLQRSAI